MFSELTHTQVEVLKLNAVGLSSCEIADKMAISEETAKTHIKNIKLRTGLQKATELVALYWCTLFGTSLEDQKRQVLAAIMLAIFMVTIIPQEHNQYMSKTRVRITRRK
uniref:helix-turn-helix domain-containing protein n=1 Tax=uncultured Dysgonomonas sp. TaxID=206096 RepID=UPI00258E5AA5|nr:helix-turn-helix transcriptional regulator [uncultured Dysgonomonas sp.]